jgi:hypothetical protein
LRRPTYRREPWFARRDAPAYGVVLDADGKIACGRGDIGDDPIVVVLTEQVWDAHLAGLRKDGVSASSPESANSTFGEHSRS